MIVSMWKWFEISVHGHISQTTGSSVQSHPCVAVLPPTHAAIVHRNLKVAMIFLWPIVTLAYFGLGLSATQLGGDIFTTFILAALTEVSPPQQHQCQCLGQNMNFNGGAFLLSYLYIISITNADTWLLTLLLGDRHLGQETVLHNVSATILKITSILKILCHLKFVIYIDAIANCVINIILPIGIV